MHTKNCKNVEGKKKNRRKRDILSVMNTYKENAHCGTTQPLATSYCPRFLVRTFYATTAKAINTRLLVN